MARTKGVTLHPDKAIGFVQVPRPVPHSEVDESSIQKAISAGFQHQSQQTVRAWGNGLGVRLTRKLAEEGHLMAGTVVTIEAVKEGLLIRPVSQPKMTLEEKLKAFDPNLHGGEVMADSPVGGEVFW